MAVQKNEFFETEKSKVLAIHKKYSTRDSEDKVQCFKCPYSLYNNYHCDCLFAKQIEKEMGVE